MRILWKVFSIWNKQPIWLKTVLGLTLGIVGGLLLGEQAKALKPIGSLFINAIMMMVGPVIFVSIVGGIIAMKDPVKMGRIALKAIALFVVTTAIGTMLALFLSLKVFEPGKNVAFNHLTKDMSIGPKMAGTPLDWGETVVGLVPSNAISAFMEGNVLQIIMISILFGLAINFVGPAGRPVERFIESLSQVIYKLVGMVMELTPYGVFALMAVITGTQGGELLAAMLKVVGIIYLCLFIMLFFVYSGVLCFVSRLNPIPFFRKMVEAQLVAFSTTSSAATLPVNMAVAEKKLGIPKNVASFILPLGSTINMNGLSTCLGVLAIFSANLYGMELSFSDLATIVFTSTIAAIGCPGVPAAGLIVLPMVLGSVGIPLEVVGIIAGMNRVIDLMSTVVNITGDTLSAVVVAKSEGDLDENVYYRGYIQTEKPISIDSYAFDGGSEMEPNYPPLRSFIAE
ncbi:MAG: dicarboxylate/amino acid:cation symporter [Deltaproteobacteria bacterium]|nr:dicarboxylate/amino acid:cation symporter [Deltaproteobacteria bacterium]